MTSRNDGLPPEDARALDAQWGRILAFWGDVDASDDTGQTTRDVLDQLRSEVMECLRRAPPDIGRAESFSAKAYHLMTGQANL